jgi:hypothetical protein
VVPAHCGRDNSGGGPRRLVARYGRHGELATGNIQL